MNSFFYFNLADILGIVLSITSIIAALSIPKAIMNYKVQSDLKMNIKSMQENVNRFRNKIQFEYN